MSESKRLAGRRGARYGAVQAVYRWLMNQVAAQQIWQEVSEWEHLRNANKAMLETLVFGTIEAAPRLNERIAAHVDRALDQLDPMEHAVLLVGAYELSESMELSKGIVINEAIELSKLFGADQAHKYVNGVLDKLSRELRPHGA
ncbi:transcription antitermination protein NusB [Oceanococcus atlanticus]|uniref:Transcription antitermination protein NusB n=1 Tax=Oceanococcus atlanticus TaxID=1317117 RepID=A0A1Y1SDP7_9GAMM|nr:transcription antitermination factor NusB [Oceanococcus atlanticus]ORE86314.1 transcription antitermination protein NusB [Oceanococcus atlanticus]